jgi:uncharacterized protein
MVLDGVVTNVTAFGAFVDIGVHQDGLVHVSELANKFVKDPAEVVKVGNRVKVRVLKVERDRKRIALSIKQASAPAPKQASAPAPKQAGATASRVEERPHPDARKGSGGPAPSRPAPQSPFNGIRIRK